MPRSRPTRILYLSIALCLGLLWLSHDTAFARNRGKKAIVSQGKSARSQRVRKIKTKKTAPRSARRSSALRVRLRSAKRPSLSRLQTPPLRKSLKASQGTRPKARSKIKALAKTPLEKHRAVKRSVQKPRLASTRKQAKQRFQKRSAHKARVGITGKQVKAPIKKRNAFQATLARVKAHPRVAQVLRFYTKLTASLTRSLDGMQARAPPKVAKALAFARTYSLSSLAAYTFSRVQKDRAFLGTFLVSNSIASNLLLPASVAFGVPPTIAAVLSGLSTPFAVGVLVLREHHLRNKAGENISRMETAGVLLKDYRNFAQKRQQSASAAAQSL